MPSLKIFGIDVYKFVLIHVPIKNWWLFWNHDWFSESHQVPLSYWWVLRAQSKPSQGIPPSFHRSRPHWTSHHEVEKILLSFGSYRRSVWGCFILLSILSGLTTTFFAFACHACLLTLSVLRATFRACDHLRQFRRIGFQIPQMFVESYPAGYPIQGVKSIVWHPVIDMSWCSVMNVECRPQIFWEFVHIAIVRLFSFTAPWAFSVL